MNGYSGMLELHASSRVFSKFFRCNNQLSDLGQARNETTLNNVVLTVVDI